MLTRLELDAPGRAAAGARRATTATRSRRRARSSTCARPPTSRPAAPPSTSPTSSTPTTARWRCAPCSAIGLDVGGVDFLTTDITESYKDVGGAHLRGQRRARLPHARGARARARRATSAGPVIDMLFPPGTPSAHPDRGDHRHQRQDHDRAHARAHPQAGRPHASASPRPTASTSTASAPSTGDMTGPVAARMVLRDPHGRRRGAGDRARRPAARRAWACRTCDVGAVLNVQADHLGLRGIDTLEQLAEVKRIVVEVATRQRGAQRRRPARACKMADHTEAKHICYVTMNPRTRAGARAHPRRRPRRSRSRRASTASMITLYDNGQPHPAALDAPDPGDARGQGAAQRAERDVRRGDGVHAWASSSRTSATACAPSTPRSSRRPGRMNVFDEHPFKVILDYGHNAAAVRGDVRPRRSGSTCSGRRIVVLAGPGRPPRRGHPRHRARSRRRPVRPLHLPPRRQPARPRRRTRCRSMLEAALLGARRRRTTQIALIPDEQAAIDAALRDGPARRPGADLRATPSPAAGSRSSTSTPPATAVPSSARAPRGRKRCSRPPSPCRSRSVGGNWCGMSGAFGSAESRTTRDVCHPERSEGGHDGDGPLHCVQGDMDRERTSPGGRHRCGDTPHRDG